MLRKRDAIPLEMHKENGIKAIEKSKSLHFLNNERKRDPLVQFDNMNCGLWAEIEFENMLADFGIKTEESNSGLDGYSNIDLIAYGLNGTKYEIEVKTSNLPANDESIVEYLNKRDLKLPYRTNDPQADLERDIYLQIVFGIHINEKENFITKLPKKLNKSQEEIRELEAETIYDEFKMNLLLDRTYFVAWDSKYNVVNFLLQTDPQGRTWSYPESQKEFYRYNLMERAKRPRDLIRQLKPY